MNEDEGELRPQIADRIGLELEVEALGQPGARAEVVRRREAFTADPDAFCAGWSAAQADLADGIAAAESRLPQVRVPDALYGAVGELVVRSGVNVEPQVLRRLLDEALEVEVTPKKVEGQAR